MEEDNSDLKSRFAVSPVVDAEIDVAAAGLVALTPDADHDLRLDVTAAVIARSLGLRSIDYVKKRYLRDLAPHKSKDREVRDLCALHLGLYDTFYRAFEPRSGERIGVFAFDMALIRARSSIELMLITARQGFLIEPCLIARSLVEQFAYAYRVWPSDEDETIFQTKPQACVGFLRAVHPAAGKAYGMLSRLAHYDPRMHYSFIGGAEQSEKGESSTVIQRSWLFKAAALAWVFFILDLRFRLFRSCYGLHPNFQIMQPLQGSILSTYDELFAGVSLPAVRDVRSFLVTG